MTRFFLSGSAVSMVRYSLVISRCGKEHVTLIDTVCNACGTSASCGLRWATADEGDEAAVVDEEDAYAGRAITRFLPDVFRSTPSPARRVPATLAQAW